MGYHVLGFQVFATVDGGKKRQAISQRFTSKGAASDYCALAVKQGFKDAAVVEIEGEEKRKGDGQAREKKEIRPPQ